MRVWFTAASAAVALTLTTGPVFAKSTAGNDKMKACAAQWQGMKASGQAKGRKYRDFSKTCMSGAPTVSAPAPAPTPQAATVAPPAPPMRAPMTRTAAAPTAAAASPAGATGQCQDGSFTHATHHSGACSHHGGVAKWM